MGIGNTIKGDEHCADMFDKLAPRKLGQCSKKAHRRKYENIER